MRTYSALLVSLLFAVAACDDNKNPPTPGPTSVPPADLAQVTPADAASTTGVERAMRDHQQCTLGHGARLRVR